MRTPIISLKSGGTKQPFFCVHPVSGDLLSYLGLVKYLDQDQPVYGIQARGREEDQQQVVSMSIEQMATAYVNALLEIQPVGPYALGGHSFGGLVAFEMAQQLRAQGCEVNALILIDSHWGRKAHGEGYERTDVQWIMGLATILASYRGKTAPLSSDEISHLSPEAQLIALRDHLVASEIIPQEMKLAGLRELLQIIKANIRSQLSYQPKMYQGKITLIQGTQAEFGDLVTKWTPFSSEPLTVYTVPGDHFLMLTEPHVQTLASQLQRFLDRIRAQGEVL
jgi:thioesterase domain-containing protein